jgi:hypothetical protein
MSRILQATRLPLVAWRSTFGWPWGILALSFAVNLAFFASIGDRIPKGQTTGGLSSIYVVVLIFAGQSITQIFPFALGLSVTRRTFYAAIWLFVLAEAVAFSVLLYLLKLVEDATNGWGISLSFYGLPFLVERNGFLQILVYLGPFILVGAIGIFSGVILKRWGLNGILALTATVLVATGAAATLVTWLGRWQAVANWFADQSTLSLMAGWPILLGLILAGFGFVIIRRATP